jgi:folate-binding protein YgfZ
MNTIWINFLTSNNATFTDNSEIQFPQNQQPSTNIISAIAHLAVIKVTGKDAVQFLQGQLTCNINDINHSNSFFAAFCNAKGRTISTLLILKSEDGFLLILPCELTDKVIGKLQMYILRSDVQLSNISDELCLIGITSNNSTYFADLPENNFAVTNDNSEIFIKMPSSENRFLHISSVAIATSLWTQLIEENNFYAHSSNSWIYHDMLAGIPWLTVDSSEEYIPQMLNIDKLGGISFNKGCYTGQEIIARTHYLGKAKRELFLAKCNAYSLHNNQALTITNGDEQAIGKVLSIQSSKQNCIMLIVIPSSEANSKNLMINNSNQARISKIDFQ